MKEEIFVPVRGYEELYEISNHGRVKSLAKKWYDKSGKMLGNRGEIILKEGYRNRCDYRFVVLCNGVDKKKYKSVHRLVAIHFIENPNNYEVVNHLDSNPRNNYFENLEWTTSSGNSVHAFNAGRRKGMKGSGHPMSKYKEADVLRIRELCASGISERDVAEMYNDRRGNINRIVRKERWKHI